MKKIIEEQYRPSVWVDNNYSEVIPKIESSCLFIVEDEEFNGFNGWRISSLERFDSLSVAEEELDKLACLVQSLHDYLEKG